MWAGGRVGGWAWIRSQEGLRIVAFARPPYEIKTAAATFLPHFPLESHRWCFSFWALSQRGRSPVDACGLVRNDIEKSLGDVLPH